MVAKSSRNSIPVALMLLTSLLSVPAIVSAGTNRPFVSRSLKVDGIERRYLIYRPANIRPALNGLVILLHGHGSSADELVGQGRGRAAPYRKWIGIADREQLVVVAPDGIAGSDGGQGWNDCRADAKTNPKSDDVAFIVKLVDAVAQDYRVRRPRVFAVGTSNGGHMALRLAIEQPRLFTAVAAVVAAMPARSQCAQPTRAVPVLFMNGTRDPLLPYQGGQMGGPRAGGERGSVLATEESVEIWRRLVGDPVRSTSTSYPDSMIQDSSRVVRTIYFKGDAPPMVVLFRVEGGGHAEPSPSERYARFYTDLVGPQNGDIEMANEVWSFFSAHPHSPSKR